MALKAGLEPHIEMYLDEMVRVVARHPSMTQMPQAAIENICRVLAYDMRPRVEVMEETELRFVFRVVSPPLASFIGGCLGNDTNAHVHTGQNAVAQSNALIGICTDAVMRTLKGKLIKVDPLNFRDSLPVGTPMLVTIEMDERERRGMRFGTIEVTHEYGETPVMKKAGLTMG